VQQTTPAPQCAALARSTALHVEVRHFAVHRRLYEAVPRIGVGPGRSVTNDLRTQALLGQLAAIEKATAPPPTWAGRTAFAAVVLTWVSMGMATNWDPMAPGMLVLYSITGAGAVAEYIRRHAARRKAERLLAQHEELQTALARLQAKRPSTHGEHQAPPTAST